MSTAHGHGHPILILGAGRGGTAMLEMFMEDDLAHVVGVSDANPEAPGLALARRHGIRTFDDTEKALLACTPCLAINLTHDESVSDLATRIAGPECVMGGQEAKLMWLMVTKLKRTRDALQKSQQELQAIIQTAIDGIITINEQEEIISFNPAAESIFGYTTEEVIGKNVNRLIPEPDRSQHNGYLERYIETGRGRIIGVGNREVTALRKDGHTFPMEISVSEMLLPDGRYFVGIVRDISDRKKAEEKIRQMAHFDQLTGLANRNLLYDRLRQALARSRRHKQPLALLFLDLDGFKPVNDAHGHDIGDLLLQKISRRLRASVREVDTVARVGGDEFVIVLNEIGKKDNAIKATEKILNAIARPCSLEGHVCQVSGSIGIAISPDDGTDIDTLMKKADDAMYMAKQSGKNGYRLYDDNGEKS